MIACPRCGTANAEGLPACVACGTAFWPPPQGQPQAAFGRTIAGGVGPSSLPAPAATAPQPRQFAGTMVGGVAPNAPAAHAPTEQQPRQFAGTMIGGIAPNAPAAHAPTEQQPRQFAGTMVGGIAPNSPAAYAPTEPQPRQFASTVAGGAGAPPAAPPPWAQPTAPMPAAPAQPPPQQPAPPATAPSLGLRQTMLGMIPDAGPARPASPAPDSAAGAAFKQTMLGMTPGAASSAPPPTHGGAPPVQAAPGFKQTMLGSAAPHGVIPTAAAPPAAWPPQEEIAAPAFAPQPAAPAAAAAPTAGLGAPASTMPSPQAMFRGTVVHGSAPTRQGAGGLPFAPAQGTPPPSAALPGAATALSAGINPKRTMQGLAHPGIAPTRPGLEAVPDMADVPPAIAPHQNARRVRSPKAVKPARIPKSAWILIAAATVLLLGAGVFALVWEAPHPIAAQVIADDHGRELLRLTCDNCPDGTNVHSGSVQAVFTGGRAVFAPPQPLRVGANTLGLEVERPGLRRDEKLTVVAPLDYRINGDFSGLSETPAKLRVVVEAVPGAAVIIDGRAVALDANGKGAHEIDVSSELEGTADAVTMLQRSVPYTVTPRDGHPQGGQVALKLGIVPLNIDAPGRRIVIDSEHFMLTGRTLKDGMIAVEGRSITVDGAGRFAQLMNVSSVGATTITVRASAKGHAPRFARVEVKRVARLKEEADALRRSAVQEYARVASDIEGHKGAQVAFAGRVVESRTENEVTLALVDVDSGCEQAPCLARVVYGAAANLAAEQKVTVFGDVTRAVDGPRSGVRIPEIAATFLLIDTKR